MAGEGELFDSKGIPIYRGDLLRRLHFIGSRRRKYYLYHTAVMRNGHLYGVPVSHLEPSKATGGGTYMLSEADASGCTIMQGYGPIGTLDFTDRPKRKVKQ